MFYVITCLNQEKTLFITLKHEAVELKAAVAENSTHKGQGNSKRWF